MGSLNILNTCIRRTLYPPMFSVISRKSPGAILNYFSISGNSGVRNSKLYSSGRSEHLVALNRHITLRK